MAVNFVTVSGKEPGTIRSRDWGQGMATNPLNKASRVDPYLVPGQKTALLIGVSQSMMTNCIDGVFTPTSPLVHNLSMFDGGVYSGEDPQLGCSWGNSNLGRPKWGGSLWPALGDKIIAGTSIQRVINAPIGVGGTSIQNHAPPGTTNATSEIGNLFDRFEALYYHLDRLRLVPSRYGTAIGTVQAAVFINIGETDAGGWGGSQALWQTVCGNLISGMRARGLASDVPILVTQNTYPYTFANTIIRAAQAAMVDHANHIYAGGDMDTLGDSYRQADGIHWNAATGAAAAAELNYQALRNLGTHWQ